MTIDPAFGLSRPSMADLQAGVTDAANGDPHVWSRLREAAQVAPGADDPEAMTRLIAAASVHPSGPVRLAVASLNIRLRAYTALMSR